MYYILSLKILFPANVKININSDKINIIQIHPIIYSSNDKILFIHIIPSYKEHYHNNIGIIYPIYNRINLYDNYLYNNKFSGRI